MLTYTENRNALTVNTWMERKESLDQSWSDLHGKVSRIHWIRQKDQHIFGANEMAQAIKKGANAATKELELTKSIEKKDKQIQELKDENEVLKKNFQIHKELNTAIDERWKCDRDMLQSTLAKLEISEEKGAQLKAAYHSEVLKSQIQKKQIYDLQREREELLNRFSKLAGDRLTHENINITDLSDANRPTKLSDTYSELYDNEWTDAFEELTDRGLTENDVIGKLLDILLLCFHKCREITWERYQTLKSIVSTIDIVHVHPCVGECSETEEKIRITLSESHLVSDKPDDTNISICCESRKDQIEVQCNAETLPLSNGSASEVQNEGKGNVQYMVGNPDVCTKNASKESEIVYSRSKEVGCSLHSKEEHLNSTATLSTSQEKQIKDIWRTTTTALKKEAVKHLYIVVLTSFDIPIKELANTSKYLTSCIDLCWKMGIQEKPMHLDAVAEKNDGSEKTFDLDKFRTYTKAGDRVDFVVWPALFLHEGGPMLVKGIAQGCKETDK